jgi:hypothetical protein
MCADAENPSRTGPDKIEVTPAMSLAGAKVVVSYYPQSLDWLPCDIATEVYRAMRDAACPE